jgi:DNA-binding NtrC family response regulator
VKQKILAVDDEPLMLKLLERIITEKTPYAVTTTNNALEVPEILQQTEFDLIVTDLKMPGMDGLDILRLSSEKGLHTVVIIITAYGSLESAVEAMSLGVFDYITKPFKKEQIIFTVERAMRWQRISREHASMAEIFDLEPYGDARNAFETEYVRRLAVRCGEDADLLTERSGLPRETIESALKQD